DEFEVMLDLDTWEETEGPVTITVSTTSDADITILKWLAGYRTVEDFDGAGNEIELEYASFNVDENGTYTVYALNTEGVEIVSAILVDNIVEPDPEIEFSFWLGTDRISQWELARGGVEYVIWGPSGSNATLTIGDERIEVELLYYHEDTIVADL